MMELVLTAAAVMLLGLFGWKQRHRHTARARKNRPLHYLSFHP